MEGVEAKMRQMDAIDLLHWNRFDLLFKYLYGHSRQRGWETTYFEEMYRHHLKVWNGFSEYDNSAKNSFDIFKADFCSLLDEIEQGGFDTNKSLVVAKDFRYLLNGAHRVAACLVYSRKVGVRQGVDGTHGQLDCSWEFFKLLWARGRLQAEFADRAALEFARLKPKSRLVILYPAASRIGKLREVRRMLRERSGIVYEKSLAIDFNGSVNLMRELYFNEEWGQRKRGAGYVAKAKFCYPRNGFFGRMAPTHVFLMEFADKDEADALKDEIRGIYGIGKHSVHINDSHEETIRLSQCLFNANSVHFLNNFNRKFFSKFEGLLTEFMAWVDDNGLDRNDYCISAGSVLSAYGLKECKDIDYLHSNPIEFVGNQLVQSHNEYGVGLYPTNVDDIVHNPRNHFYRYGVKFSSLEVVAKLKRKRGERKDFRDLKMIGKLM